MNLNKVYLNTITFQIATSGGAVGGAAPQSLGAPPPGYWIPPWVKYDSAGRRVFSIQVGHNWGGHMYL